MKDRIQKLLGAGLSPALVSTVVGCDPSYISQLLGDSTFSASVASLRVKDIEELRARDGKYDRLEDEFLERLERLLPLMMKPRDVLTALQVINNAKRRSEAIIKPETPGVVNNIVVLQLPKQVVNSFELNNKNEIVSIDEQALVAMPTSALMKEVNQNADSPPTTTLESLPTEERLLTDERTEVEKRIVSEDSI